MFTAFLPTLLKVSGSAAADPSATLPKSSSVGDNSTRVPSPTVAVVWGLLPSLSVTVIFPVIFPVALGLNVTQIPQSAVQLPSVLCGFRTVPAVQYVVLPVEQSATGVQLCPVTENSGLLLIIELMVSGVDREL
jgi:hypothetical protein